MKKPTKKLLLLAAGISLCIVATYAAVRVKQIAGIKDQLHSYAARAAKRTEALVAVDNLIKKFPPQANTASFVESLYDLSKRSGFENVEITTASTSPTAGGAQPRKSPQGRDAAKPLRPYQIKVSGEGRYHTIAQYLKFINAMERYSNVVSMDMKPDKHTIRTNITLEIVSFEGQDAS